MPSAGLLIELGAVIFGLGVLGRLARLIRLSPIPLYLLAGLAFGKGGLLPLAASEQFLSEGAEIGSFCSCCCWDSSIRQGSSLPTCERKPRLAS